jgi:hypothetical protein
MRKNVLFKTSNIKTLLIFIFLSSICTDVSYGELTEDAIVLTLRCQEGIRLDSTMAAEIDSGLIAARAQINILDSIHVFPEYVPGMLIVATDAAWNLAWQKGELLTGEPYIDSLSTEYNLIGVEYHDHPWGDTFILNFAMPLEMRKLSELYEAHPDVRYSEPNFYIGDGNNIEYFKKNGILHFAFSQGWGDCPAGCIERYYWYVTVTRSDTGSTVCLEEEKYRDFLIPYFYRWNIPPRYAMTMFTNVDSILQAITDSPAWWVRRHAIEGTWRFFVYTYPWAGEDGGNHWYALQDELKSRTSEVIAMIQSALNDADPDVSASAQYALTQIVSASVDKDLSRRPLFELHQNYPNPFNPTTKITYSIQKSGDVKLKIFDLLGREIQTLVNGFQKAGTHSIDFNAAGLSSGVYFYQLRMGNDLIETKRMLIMH